MAGAASVVGNRTERVVETLVDTNEIDEGALFALGRDELLARAMQQPLLQPTAAIKAMPQLLSCAGVVRFSAAMITSVPKVVLWIRFLSRGGRMRPRLPSDAITCLPGELSIRLWSACLLALLATASNPLSSTRSRAQAFLGKAVRNEPVPRNAFGPSTSRTKRSRAASSIRWIGHAMHS
jgi:hypothetical protein